jgi:quinol monooxygenase YgiN
MISDDTENMDSIVNSRRSLLGLGAAAAVLGFNRLTYAQDAAPFYTQLGNATILAGMEDQALQIFREMVEVHRENSPALLVYLVHRSRTDPRRIVTFEVFQDEPSAQATAGAQIMFPLYRRLQTAVQDVETVPLDRALGFLR